MTSSASKKELIESMRTVIGQIRSRADQIAQSLWELEHPPPHYSVAVPIYDIPDMMNELERVKTDITVLRDRLDDLCGYDSDEFGKIRSSSIPPPE